MDNYLRSQIFADEAAFESLVDMRTAQPAKDRMDYFDIVLEGTNESNATMIQKLYTDIVSKSNIDFGAIPDSKGNLVRYKEYPLMQQSMDRVNALFKGIASDEVKLMNQMHDMIINSKKDYEVGFTYDVEIIKVIYNTSVMTLYELINICILSYTRQMRKNAGIQFDLGKMKKKDNMVLKNAKSLLKSYHSGQWSAIVREIKKNKNMFNVATEAGKFNFGGTAVAARDTIVNVVSSHPVLTIPLIVVGGLILLLFAIRGLIYWFFSGSAKVKDYVDTQKEFVTVTMNNEKLEGVDEKIINKRSKLLDKLDSITRFIEGKIFRTNQKAKEELAKSNTENFNKSSFGETSAPSGFGSAGSISF